jgi:replicative DNA helicase
MNDQIEHTIIRNLLHDDAYLRKVLPFLKLNYFEDNYKTIFTQIGKFVLKYNKKPTKETLLIEINNSDIQDESYSEVKSLIDDLFHKVDVDNTWLLNSTEEWCQQRALFIAVMESISILDGKHKTLTKNAMPELLQSALNVTFNRNVGHDYINDVDARFEYYTKEEYKIPFELDMLNKITLGGISKKTLSIILAGTGVGKSLAMCSLSASYLSQGLNVLYITAEMSEEKIAERIDANLLDIPIHDLKNIAKTTFTEKIAKLRTKTNGNLIIKEYPTAAANVNHFRALLNELKLKKDFIPSVIVIDYLNICASSRLKSMGGSINSYTYIKAIAEEFRGLAVEFDVPVISATQTTRSGFGNSDPGLEDTSESFGLPATADFMIAMISSEELEDQGKIMIKQLKNRYNDTNVHKKFVLGINRPKMRLEDDEDQSMELVTDTPVFDKSEINEKFKDFKL